MITCKTYTGSITVDNLSNQWVSFAGNVTALVMGGVISIVLSLIWPANFDFDNTRNKTSLAEQNTELIKQESSGTTKLDETKDQNVEIETEIANSDLDMDLNAEIDHKHLDQQFKKYTILVIVLAIIFVFIIPVPLGGSPYVFSPNFLLGCVIIIIIWLFFSLFYVVILPLFEARKTLWQITKQILRIDSKSE